MGGGPAPCLAGCDSAVAHQSPRSLTPAGVSSSASMRNTLLEEDSQEFSVEIPNPNCGNLFYNHIASYVSGSAISAFTPEKGSGNILLLHSSPFLFSQCNKATSIKKEQGELISFGSVLNRKFACPSHSKEKYSLGVSTRTINNLAPFLH